MERSHRRSEILSAARRVFAARGYHEASVSDIIEAARIARGTFYLYFDSKRAVFDELVDKFLVEVQSCVRTVQLGPDEPSPYTQIHANVSRVLALVLDEPEMARIVLDHAVGLDRAADETLRSFYDEIAGSLVRALDAGRTFGMVTAASQLAARMILGGVKEVVHHFLEQPSTAAHDEVVDELLRICLTGVVGSAPADGPASPVPALLPDSATSPSDRTGRTDTHDRALPGHRHRRRGRQSR